ncbi:GNAT family N-acetyltransferase [Rouxiella badensis]|jgi:RimJ/RimL family protein N-acetyltransferase|uniref:GNAT family N-acetyltransferase n=1 Tax=Rouxiella badensis TaxID=1646377 RepID=A0A1X0WHF4_9GAMM|nr:GNAT family N-acetyltransferase [Rouxiella badensis]MCC3704958.1 GNAT family N-acetyltransferase [Rouxiella badensis]MCC3721416.1 GNAT family N-acetyltransferase [Rouxiella badensis]MCC3730981.1 GNAT family N-acetyltransferase [Rouxiella badensis]MCC3735198.1 GNAT family N-acetyltransferase [Rouxiella badensis]MCC3742292.1 GNAT family N-acetyltransferase [Rouxiella badensis]
MNISQDYNVTLRTWEPEDVKGYSEMASNQEVMKFISSGKPRTKETIEQEIARFRASQEQYGFSRWAATLGEEHRFMGFAGFEKKEYGINFGMRYDSQWWGTPWPFIAGHLALSYAFDKLGLEEVYTLTNIKNVKAINMNMKYLGLKTLDDGIFETEFGPHQRIILTQKLFQSVREMNEGKIIKLVGSKRYSENRIN